MVGLTTLPHKIMMGGLGVALVAATTFNVVQAIENRALSSTNAKLDTQINDPATGYVVRLSQARSNVTTCAAAVDRQTKAIQRQSTTDSAAIAAVQARYDAEHIARTRAERSAAAFLARQPQGATVTDRVLDVDAQILGDLK